MILLVTIDGLDWATLEDAIRGGRLAAAAPLLKSASITRLRPENGPAGCAWWTSLATGCSPREHGVVYPLERWAGGLRPVSRASWRRPPVWQVLAERGFRTASIAYPFSQPGASWPGVHVDARILNATGLGWDDWPLPVDVAPQAIREELRAARVHPSEVPAAMLAPFAGSGRLDERTGPALAVALARTSTVFGALEVVAAAQPEFLAVHLDWPVHFAAALGVAEGGELPLPFWSLFDGALWKLAQVAGDDSTLLLVSPGAAGRSGFMFVRGDGATERGTSASVLDIAPRLLAVFDETLATGANGWRDAPTQPDVSDCNRVTAFGYRIPEPPPGWPAPRLIAEAELLLATDLEGAGAKATEALAAAPESERALALAGLVAFARRDLESLQRYADRIAAAAPDHLWTAMLGAGCHVLRKDARQAAPLLRRIEAEGAVDDRLRAAGAWLMLGRGRDAERLFESIIDESPDCIPALLGLASRKSRRPFDAEQLLRRALAADPGHADARTALADLLSSVGRSEDATAVRRGV